MTQGIRLIAVIGLACAAVMGCSQEQQAKWNEGHQQRVTKWNRFWRSEPEPVHLARSAPAEDPVKAAAAAPAAVENKSAPDATQTAPASADQDVARVQEMVKDYGAHMAPPSQQAGEGEADESAAGESHTAQASPARPAGTHDSDDSHDSHGSHVRTASMGDADGRSNVRHASTEELQEPRSGMTGAYLKQDRGAGASAPAYEVSGTEIPENSVNMAGAMDAPAGGPSSDATSSSEDVSGLSEAPVSPGEHASGVEEPRTSTAEPLAAPAAEDVPGESSDALAGLAEAVSPPQPAVSSTAEPSALDEPGGHWQSDAAAQDGADISTSVEMGSAAGASDLQAAEGPVSTQISAEVHAAPTGEVRGEIASASDATQAEHSAAGGSAEPAASTAATEPLALAEVEVAAGPDPAEALARQDAEPASSGHREASSNSVAPPPQIIDTLGARLQALESKVSANPNDMQSQLDLRMLQIAAGHEEQALAATQGVNQETQDFAEVLIKTLLAARSSDPNDPAAAANKQLETVDQLHGMVSGRADLRLPKVALCTWIYGFGLYDPITPAEFPHGAKNEVYIYIEVDNFKSVQKQTGQYRTVLALRLTLLRPSGEEIWTERIEKIEDLSWQRRRDFYLRYGPMTALGKLAAGEYLLKVEVEDVFAGKFNTETVKFRITAE